MLLRALLHNLSLQLKHLLLSLLPRPTLEQVQEPELTPSLEWEAQVDSQECLVCPEWLLEVVLLAWEV